MEWEKEEEEKEKEVAILRREKKRQISTLFISYLYLGKYSSDDNERYTITRFLILWLIDRYSNKKVRSTREIGKRKRRSRVNDFTRSPLMFLTLIYCNCDKSCRWLSHLWWWHRFLFLIYLFYNCKWKLLLCQTVTNR